jgi:hypothetical protein
VVLGDRNRSLIFSFFTGALAFLGVMLLLSTEAPARKTPSARRGLGAQGFYGRF